MAEIKNFRILVDTWDKKCNIYAGSVKPLGGSLYEWGNNQTLVQEKDIINACYELIKEKYRGSVDCKNAEGNIEFTIAIRGKQKDSDDIYEEFEKQISLIAFEFGLKKEEVRKKMREWLNESVQ